MKNSLYPDSNSFNVALWIIKLESSKIKILICFWSGLSVVADSLSAIKYAKVKAIRDEDGIVVDYETEGDFPKYGNDDDLTSCWARLYELECQKKQDAESEARRSQIGTGDRSEKIRTYNFPQGRVTDHRIKFTSHRLDEILNGHLEEIIDNCIAADQAAKLSNMND